MSATLIDNPSMNQRMSINFIIKIWRKFNMKLKKKKSTNVCYTINFFNAKNFIYMNQYMNQSIYGFSSLVTAKITDNKKDTHNKICRFFFCQH